MLCRVGTVSSSLDEVSGGGPSESSPAAPISPSLPPPLLSVDAVAGGTGFLEYLPSDCGASGSPRPVLGNTKRLADSFFLGPVAVSFFLGPAEGGKGSVSRMWASGVTLPSR